MLSYWENKHFLNADLIVVGAGFVGLSTAIHFKRAHPSAKVLILERGIFPTGASTKNAGFACFGSLTEILDDLNHMTEDEVRELVKLRFEGLESIRKEFSDLGIAYQASGGFELIEEDSLNALEKLKFANQLLSDLFQEDVFESVAEFKHFGFGEKISAIVKNKFEGELDPGKYVNKLWGLASTLGVKIITGARVIEVEKDEGQVIVENLEAGNVQFQANLIAICTNAFTQKLIKEPAIEPGRGLILLSKPLDFEIPWEGSFHIDKGFVYFRKVDQRLLIGGARNIDFIGENSIDFQVNPRIKDHLINLTKEQIFPDKEIQWESEWTGIMAFGKKKTPIIQCVGLKTAMAVRLGGMGVAIGWEVGKGLSRTLEEI